MPGDAAGKDGGRCAFASHADHTLISQPQHSLVCY